MDETDILAIYINKLVQFTRIVCLQIEGYFWSLYKPFSPEY